MTKSQVTANKRASHNESGSKSKIKKARLIELKAAAHEAFIKINASTPDFTASPIFLGEGTRTAFTNEEKMIQANGNKNSKHQ